MSNLVPFSFESHEIRTITDDVGDPWFVASDVAIALNKPEEFFAKSHLTLLEMLFCSRLLEDPGTAYDRHFNWISEVGKIGFNQNDLTLFSKAYSCIALDTARRSLTSESTLMEKFKNGIGTYISGATIVSGPTSFAHRPDAWVMLQSGEVCPVEGKHTIADKKALKQLLRYMQVFSRSTGVLVAQFISVEIPKNVIFVKIDLQ